MKNERSLYWGLILYEDSDNLKFSDFNFSNYEYLYIKHDKDKTDDGSLKKTHYHVVLKFKNYKWLSSLSDETGIPYNYFEKIRSLDNILCYLIHYKEDSKYHYNFDDLVGSSILKSKLKKIINNFERDETDIMCDFMNFINSSKKIKFIDLYRFAVDNQYWSEFRRNYSILKDLTMEHNQLYNNYEKGE